MKREEIKAIFADATDEQIKAVMDLNGADAEKSKSKIATLEKELAEAKENYQALNGQFEELKTANASGEEWKSKFEALQAENEAKEKQAEAERILAEKQANIEKRFAECMGDKKFSHEAIKADYLRKFGEAIEVEENKSKGDKEIFQALIKDDANAFEGVKITHLVGGNAQNAGGKKYESKADIMAIKDPIERQSAIANNMGFFKN